MTRVRIVGTRVDAPASPGGTPWATFDGRTIILPVDNGHTLYLPVMRWGTFGSSCDRNQAEAVRSLFCNVEALIRQATRARPDVTDFLLVVAVVDDVTHDQEAGQYRSHCRYGLAVMKMDPGIPAQDDTFPQLRNVLPDFIDEDTLHAIGTLLRMSAQLASPDVASTTYMAPDVTDLVLRSRFDLIEDV